MTYVYAGPSTWSIVAIAVLAAAVFALVYRGLEWLEDWWRRRRRPPGLEFRPLPDVADDPDVDRDRRRWVPPLRWAANGRYVHRVGCEHMTTGEPINVWSPDAARRWAEGVSPRLAGCPHCTPFALTAPTEEQAT